MKNLKRLGFTVAALIALGLGGAAVAQVGPFSTVTTLSANNLLEVITSAPQHVFITAANLKTYVLGGGSGVLPVASGGTGAATLTSKGVVYGNGTSAVGITAAGTNGQVLLGVTAGNPAFGTVSQDCAITNAGVLTCTKTNNVSFGTAATVNTGTSGATIPLLNGANVFSGATNSFSGQIITSAGLPTIASGACGTTTNGAVVAGSTNQAGNITIGAAATTVCTVSFSATLASAPKSCVIQPANAAAAAVGTTIAYVSSITTAQFVITGSALANANYSYICL